MDEAGERHVGSKLGNATLCYDERGVPNLFTQGIASIVDCVQIES